MIKALLYKDIKAIKRYAKTMLIIGIICTLLFREQGSSLIIMIYASSLLLTTLAIDEREHFFRRIISDKGRSKEIVWEKYILILLLILAGGVLSVVLEGILSVVMKREFIISEVVEIVALGFALTSFSGGTTIPLTIKYGSEKARLILLSCYMIPAVAIMWLLPNINPEMLNPYILIPALILLSLLFLSLSCLLSLAIFKKKDF